MAGLHWTKGWGGKMKERVEALHAMGRTGVVERAPRNKNGVVKRAAQKWGTSRLNEEVFWCCECVRVSGWVARRAR